MQPKAVKIIYWIFLAIFCLSLIADGIGGITMAKQGVEVLQHLGYPTYIMPLMGYLKILGVVALLQPKYQRIKEWVYAGVTFIFIGAIVSHLAVGDHFKELFPPIISLGIMVTLYIYWKGYQKTKSV